MKDPYRNKKGTKVQAPSPAFAAAALWVLTGDAVQVIRCPDRDRKFFVEIYGDSDERVRVTFCGDVWVPWLHIDLQTLKDRAEPQRGIK